MSEILIRSGKDPFTPVGAEASALQNVINTNVGNYLFADSVHKTLMVPGTEIVSNGTMSERIRVDKEDCERVNERFDAFVVPLANAFRPSFQRQLGNLTALIEGLEIPVVVVGVGAQAGLDLDSAGLDEISPTVKAFVSAVLDRSSSIGVRGEFTRDYLMGLGFSGENVDVIGCPSLFLRGSGFRLPEATGSLDRDSLISMSVTPYVAALAEIIEHNVEKYPNLMYMGQHIDDLNLMLWGQNPPPGHEVALTTDHVLYRTDRMRFFLDSWTWFDYLAERDFLFGSRFHGTVAGLLARIPGMLLAHDSRTLELAEYHAMPHRRISDVPARVDAADLYAQYDPAPFNAAYDDRFAAYLRFLERNGLSHIHQQGSANPEFERRVAAAEYPPPVRTLGAADGSEIAARLRWLRDGQPFGGRFHKEAYRPPFPDPGWPEPSTFNSMQRTIQRTGRRLERTEARLARQRQRLDRQQRQLEQLRVRLAAAAASTETTGAGSEKDSPLRRLARRFVRRSR
jgi:hypothetical protein